ncbi:MAG: RNA:NAD 2'-phosphotransferase [uncultured Solirubrobacteraceae bacterium]|uniref:Probable RNA 2'-phosphotransferase n=1 Tax=uncultured Solirubrobacteraceae bacterium TaxID=1162706 RepID=A0A6J4SW54_9ACTN|nr:MAG: RNA:NAD 2'-phosphotransferase [uncultured Solirubrobacteraceae bacterium]
MSRRGAERPVRVSRFLARHLRHAPEAIGITLDGAGWAEVDALLAAAARAGFPISREELDAAVHAPGKRRYVLDASGARIRAAQGHSVAVDLGLDPVPPPAELFHGTHAGVVEAILREGLEPMGRLQVHLSSDRDTAVAVGARRGRPVVLVVDAAGLAATGVPFRLAENGVWLVDRVPPDYVRRDG